MIRNVRMVLLHTAEPGMVLSDSLLDRHGKVLLPAQTILDEKLLESLRRHDIDVIPVFGEAMTEEQMAAQIESSLARLDRLFRKGNYGNADENANDLLLTCLQKFRRGQRE